MGEIKAVGIVRLYPDSKEPVRTTEKSACYDMFAYLNSKENALVKMYDAYDVVTKIAPVDNKIVIPPFCRALIPSGIKFKIPAEYSIRIHPRSGNALKRGLSLPNCEGVIDEDYPEQTYAILTNYTFMPKTIEHEERVCQLELVPVIQINFVDVPDFGAFTDRKSGLGHTGAK